MPLSMVLTAHLVQKQNNKILWSPCFRDTFTFPQGIQARRVIVQLLNSIFSFSKKHSLQSFSFMLNFGKRPGFRELFTFLHRLLEERLGAVSRLRCPVISHSAGCPPPLRLSQRGGATWAAECITKEIPSLQTSIRHVLSKNDSKLTTSVRPLEAEDLLHRATGCSWRSPGIAHRALWPPRHCGVPGTQPSLAQAPH